MIQEAGDYLRSQQHTLAHTSCVDYLTFIQNKLPNSLSHPKGRNPYAHVALCVKDKFGLSYKDITDENFNKVQEYIDFLKKNPN